MFSTLFYAFQHFFQEVNAMKEKNSAVRPELGKLAKVVNELEAKFNDSFVEGKAAFENIRASKFLASFYETKVNISYA